MRRRQTVKRLIAATLCVGVVYLTAPSLEQYLGQIAGVAARQVQPLPVQPEQAALQVSKPLSELFGFLGATLPEQPPSSSLTETPPKDPLDDVSIHELAGLMTDPETQTPFVLPEDGMLPEEHPDNIPAPPKNAGKIERKTLSAGKGDGFVKIGDSVVKNTTPLTHKQIQAVAKQSPPFSLQKDSDLPQVLIYHTHATESFQPYLTDWFDPSLKIRSKDNAKNMIAIGDILEQKLADAGIVSIHNTTHFDLSYTDAYDRSRVMIKQILEEHPSIKVVLDVHRDAIGKDPMIAPVTAINGQSVAQVMIISGYGTKAQAIPNHKQNLAFATTLQQQLDQDYPTLARPLLFGNRFYNQDLSTGALLLEIGGHANSLGEASRAMSYTANSLITVLQATME